MTQKKAAGCAPAAFCNARASAFSRDPAHDFVDSFPIAGDAALADRGADRQLQGVDELVARHVAHEPGAIWARIGCPNDVDPEFISRHWFFER